MLNPYHGLYPNISGADWKWKVGNFESEAPSHRSGFGPSKSLLVSKYYVPFFEDNFILLDTPLAGHFKHVLSANLQGVSGFVVILTPPLTLDRVVQS